MIEGWALRVRQRQQEAFGPWGDPIWGLRLGARQPQLLRLSPTRLFLRRFDITLLLPFFFSLAWIGDFLLFPPLLFFFLLFLIYPCHF